VTRVAIVFLVALTVLAGCEHTSSGPNNRSARRDAAPSRASVPLPRVVVVREDGKLLERCGTRVVANRVNRFLSAFNRGDIRELHRSIADRWRFQWFSLNEAGSASEHDFTATGERSVLGDSTGQDQRPALFRHFAMRHGRGERLRLVELRVSRIRPRTWVPAIDEEVAGIEFAIRVDSHDFGLLGGGNHLGGGKGTLACGDGRILAWSSGVLAHRRYPAGGINLCYAKRKLWRRMAAAHPARPATIACG
jgi:hypothetical protein